MNKNIRQKFIISAALMIAATASVFAQGNGLAGINEATSMVSSYFDPGTKLIYAIGAASSSVLVWQTFALNARYGEHGLMKLGAARSHPRYLINRRRITRLLKRQRKEETT